MSASASGTGLPSSNADSLMRVYINSLSPNESSYEETESSQSAPDSANPDPGEAEAPVKKKKDTRAQKKSLPLQKKPVAPQRKNKPPELEKWCFCRQGDDGSKMIECSGKECTRQWFHINCLGDEEIDEDKEWLCIICHEVQNGLRPREGHGLKWQHLHKFLDFSMQGAPRGPAEHVYGLSSRNDKAGEPDVAGSVYDPKERSLQWE